MPVGVGGGGTVGRDRCLCACASQVPYRMPVAGLFPPGWSLQDEFFTVHVYCITVRGVTQLPGPYIMWRACYACVLILHMSEVEHCLGKGPGSSQWIVESHSGWGYSGKHRVCWPGPYGDAGSFISEELAQRWVNGTIMGSE